MDGRLVEVHLARRMLPAAPVDGDSSPQSNGCVFRGHVTLLYVVSLERQRGMPEEDGLYERKAGGWYGEASQGGCFADIAIEHGTAV